MNNRLIVVNRLIVMYRFFVMWYLAVVVAGVEMSTMGF